ncbi:hypothetical protein Acr_00g0058850 [Actinidia rufa]|uniref:Reverse transcriptase/retrotransposon-derived protein RNase H-like domain-containing protein n=1 Tax=Actinidia rufa TaxID=165716 RepID=A0A7J0DPX0_9ERIC|nr:hypothetical protein Acr_00g0058850 [Actinidia rufa]
MHGAMRGGNLWEVWAWHLVVREVKVGRDRGIPSNPLIVIRVSRHLLLLSLGHTRRDHPSLATSVAKRVLLGVIVHKLCHSLDLRHHCVLKHRVLALGVVDLATWLGFAHKKRVHVVSPVQFSNRGRVRVLVSISRGGRVFAVTTVAPPLPPITATQTLKASIVRGTFVLFNSFAGVLFDSRVSHSFIAAFVLALGLKTKELNPPLFVDTPIEFDLILGMDCLSTFHATIDYFKRRVRICTLEGGCLEFFGERQESFEPYLYEPWDKGSIAYLLASLTLDEDLSTHGELPRVVCDFPDIFQEELPSLPPEWEVEFTIDLLSDNKCESAFKELKTHLTRAPILIVLERGVGYSMYCDASREGLRCVLMQNGHVVAYGLRQLKTHERN